MKCNKVREMFSGYLENALDDKTLAAFEQHLAECGSCKTAYQHFNAAVVMLDEMPEVEPPAGFHASVMTRVEQLRRTSASPVRWWQIDWQQVFTIRVPARAAAVACAALVLMAMVVRLTPVGTGVMSLFGIQRVTKNSICTDPNTIPAWQLGDDKIGGGDLRIGVIADVGVRGSVYSLRFETKSNKPLDFEVKAGDESYSGSVVHNQVSVIEVPVVGAAVTAEVTWRGGGRGHTELAFLPSRFDLKAGAKKLSLQFTHRSVRDMLATISQKYGVVVLASGELSKTVPFAVVESGSPEEALYYGVEMTSANMKRSTLAPSVYIVEPAR